MLLGSPPDYFRCDELVVTQSPTEAPFPTETPTEMPFSNLPQATVLVHILVDEYPTDICWQIRDGDFNTIQEVDFNTYEEPFVTYSTLVSLDLGVESTFTLSDQFCDGCE